MVSILIVQIKGRYHSTHPFGKRGVTSRWLGDHRTCGERSQPSRTEVDSRLLVIPAGPKFRDTEPRNSKRPKAQMETDQLNIYTEPLANDGPTATALTRNEEVKLARDGEATLL